MDLVRLDLLREVGALALGNRLKRLSDRLMQDGIKIYQQSKLDFEPKWFPIFYYLSERGPSSVTDIARGIGITHPSVNQIAKEMGHRGYIAAYKDPKDKRRRVLALSAHGKAQRETLASVWTDIHCAFDELIRETGMDVLAQIESLERALAEKSLLARFSDAQASHPQEFQIVSFRPELAETFLDLIQQWNKTLLEAEVDRIRQFRDPEQQIVGQGGAILFAEDAGGEIVGTCALLYRDAKTAQLLNIAVSRSHQGRGAGKLLGSSILALSEEMGFERVFIETNLRLAPAIGLYQWLGFVRRPFPGSAVLSGTDVYMERYRQMAVER